MAVLPFENLSPNPDDAYFAPGFHDEVLNQLAKIQDLTVIARTTMLQYEGVERPIEEIAAELNVETEWRVAFALLTIRFVSPHNSTMGGLVRICGPETYTRPFENIFEIETSIATGDCDGP